MNQKNQAPEAAEVYRYYIKQFVDSIQDANSLWQIYTIARCKAEREAPKAQEVTA